MIRSAIIAAFGLLIANWASRDAEAVPRPEDKGKSYVFPAGRYVLAGGPEAAIGDDMTELFEDFRMKPGQYILSGGPNPTDEIRVDDDLELRQGEKVLFVDHDNVATTEKRGKQAASYQGRPIIFVADAKQKIRIKAMDFRPTEAILGPLWLHRHDGAKRKITDEVRQPSAEKLPHVFFNEEFDLSKGFEMPATIRTGKGSAIDLPERPAMLLPKNKSSK